jgi:hypothetical protein
MVDSIDNQIASSLVIDRSFAGNEMLHSLETIRKESLCLLKGSPSYTDMVKEHNAREIATRRGSGVLKNGKTETLP